MKTESDIALDTFLDKLEEERLLRDNAPVRRQSHTPHECLGYRIGTEIFEDRVLDAETHPSNFVPVEEIADVLSGAGEEDFSSNEPAAAMDDVHEDGGDTVATHERSFDPIELLELDMDRVCFGRRH